jgi:hypothetical protein
MLLKRKTIRCLTAVLATSSMCLTGCGGSSKEDIESEYEALSTDYALLQEDYNTALDTIDELQSEIEDSSGVKEDNGVGIEELDLENKADDFTQLGSKLKFDTTLKYTDAYQAPNTSKVMLSDDVSIDPSNNWVIEMDGTSTKYNHPMGIVGNITIESIDETVDDIFLESEILQPFLDTLNIKSNYTYKIYVGSTWSGMCNTALVTTDTGTAMIKSGIIGYNKTAITYCFYYDGDMDKTKNELIDLLIRSIVINKENVKIDS